MSDWTVAKFGGTSMATVESMTQCAKVVALRGANVVLVSATSGTTNQLVELTKLAKAGELDQANDILDTISNRHSEMMRSVNACLLYTSDAADD